MVRHALVAVVVFALQGSASANTFKVTNTQDAGTGSLRWAILRANNHAGPDRIVFRPGLLGRAIQPTSALPKILDAETKILGDINHDGRPDIALNGVRAGPTSGLRVAADGCVIAGLAVRNFQHDGIQLNHASNCVIRSCHLGVNLPGTRAARNGGHQIKLYASHDNIIGGQERTRRNIIAAGTASPERSGVHLLDSCRNYVSNNNVGLARDGVTPLTPPQDSGVGITLATSVPVVLGQRHGEAPATTFSTEDNVVGGATADRNVIGSMRTGIRISNADENFVRSNYIGLARNGRTAAGITNQCIRVDGGSKGNFIGGTLGHHGNVFAGGAYGVYITDAGTEENMVKGSYFGLTASGTAQRPLTAGVVVSGSAGKQRIGGPASGNFFCPKHPGQTTFGVLLFFGGEGTWVAYNQFGVRPDGEPAVAYDYGVSATDVETDVFGNLFRGADRAVDFSGTPASSSILISMFHDCNVAVRLRNGAQALLGDRGNDNAGDDGWNEFHSSNTWYIRNETPNFVKAEGNHFPPGFFNQIDEKIWDWRDDHSRGLVDYLPAHLDLPQGRDARLAPLSAAAAPVAGGGAEIAFSLSAPAQVSIAVVNIAGRRVATVARDTALGAGTQRTLWDGRSDGGTRVPAGRYLVRITARKAAGEQATALVALTVRR